MAYVATYRVTYNTNGGSVSPNYVDVISGNSITLPLPTYSGYTFNGWYKESSLTNFIGNNGSSYSPVSDATLHAAWRRITTTCPYWNTELTTSFTDDSYVDQSYGISYQDVANYTYTIPTTSSTKHFMYYLVLDSVWGTHTDVKIRLKHADGTSTEIYHGTWPSYTSPSRYFGTAFKIVDLSSYKQTTSIEYVYYSDVADGGVHNGSAICTYLK